MTSPRCALIAVVLALGSCFSTVPADYMQHHLDAHYKVPEEKIEKTAFIQVETAGQQVPLNCVCKDYECSCRKECYCKIVKSDVRTEEKTVFIETEGGESKKVNDALFKCACDFRENDVEFNENNALDCDCSSVKCNCLKRCTCDT